MAIRTIRVMGDEILEKKCREIKEVTPRIQELIDDMFDTMYDANGRGSCCTSGWNFKTGCRD